MHHAKPKLACNGICLLNKPPGLTSQQAISRFKSYTTSKIGHTGTLDPFATGMLAVTLGEATKFSQYILKADKAYTTTIQFGSATHTDDSTGQVTEQKPVPSYLSTPFIKDILAQYFTGSINQVSPTFSALKHQGKPHYYYARQGITVPKKSRTINIHAYQHIEYQPHLQQLQLTLTCSSGTYIRSLARDLGEHLKTKAHCLHLNRDYIEPWSKHSCMNLDSISDPIQLPQHILPIDPALPFQNHLNCSKTQLEKLQQGQFIPLDHLDGILSTTDPITNLIKLFYQEHFYGLVKINKPHQRLEPIKVIQTTQL